jgi:hypothetical protein
MPNQGSYQGGWATRQEVGPNGEPVGPAVKMPLMVHPITRQQFNGGTFGLAPAPGEDNDAYAANYNTD